jgi:hypothetical protein
MWSIWWWNTLGGLAFEKVFGRNFPPSNHWWVYLKPLGPVSFQGARLGDTFLSGAVQYKSWPFRSWQCDPSDAHWVHILSDVRDNWGPSPLHNRRHRLHTDGWTGTRTESKTLQEIKAEMTKGSTSGRYNPIYSLIYRNRSVACFD